MAGEQCKLEYVDLLGKEFEYGGRGPDTYDCYGLVIEVRKRLGLKTPDEYFSCDNPIIISASYEDAIQKHFVKLEKPQPYCFVGLVLRPPFMTHIGVVFKNCYQFIHIMPKMRVAVERLDAICWKHRIVGFYEYV
jgi:murein DD-endopeptidase